MFNMKFHADERSMDMTRRRRWHRKMVPSAEQTFDASGSEVAANTDIVFRMQSQVPAIADSPTKSEQQEHEQTDGSVTTVATTKEVKIELNAPRMYLAFKSNCLSRTRI